MFVHALTCVAQRDNLRGSFGRASQLGVSRRDGVGAAAVVGAGAKVARRQPLNENLSRVTSVTEPWSRGAQVHVLWQTSLVLTVNTSVSPARAADSPWVAAVPPCARPFPQQQAFSKCGYRGACAVQDYRRAGATFHRARKLAQKTQVGPCIPVGIQLERAEVGPTSGPTLCLSQHGAPW